MIHLPYDQLTHDQIIYALGEEIGDPELFVGRRSGMARLSKPRWLEKRRRLLRRDQGNKSRVK